MDFEKSFASRAQFDAFDEDDVPSTFADTFRAAKALQLREENFQSIARALQKPDAEVKSSIEALGGNPVLVDIWQNMDRNRRMSLRESELKGELNKNPLWRGMHSYARQAYRHVRAFEREFPDQVPDDRQIFEKFKADAAELRAAEHHTIERGGGGAMFLGAMAGVLQDPLVLSTLPLGAGLPAGRTALATIGRVAGIEGAIGAGIEIPIQANVFQQKRQLQSPWSFRQSALNVLAAGAGGAALGGVVAGGVVGARNALASYKAAKAAKRVDSTQAMDDAEQILDETLALHDENPLAIEIDGERFPFDDSHERAFETARAQHEDNLPVDVGEDVLGLEPRDGINLAIERSTDPDGLVSLDPRELVVDAETFQFKSGADSAGVNDTLRGVKKFDQRLAGVSLIWERKDGTRFVADGHQRHSLGVRAIAAGQDVESVRLNGFILREADGISAADARQMAAVKNMAEGTGSALDAAKILRAVGPAGEALLPPLPPRSALVRQARGLANLGEDQFMQVINGVIDTRFGALVGSASVDPKLQSAMIDVLRRTKPANEVQARSIVDQVRTVGTETRVSEDLFGETQVTESLYLERAQVLDAALRDAKKDKAVFGRLLTDENRITEAGENVLDRNANFERMQEATNAQAQISRLANTRGPISEALTEAARQVKAGKKPAAVAADFLEATKRALSENDPRGGAAGGTRPGSDAKGVKPEVDPEVSPTGAARPAATVNAAPRSIVRDVTDDTLGTPDATRTGTIPDSEYETVLARANELIEDHGDLAVVGREINGELQTRTLASEIESLDVLEDTLERIRTCTVGAKAA